MDNVHFNEVLDLAIGRERSAVQFYEELSRLASFAAQKSVLGDFRAMEEGHVTMLVNMKGRGIMNLSSVPAVDLGLARKLDAAEKPTASMDYQDILVAAIKKEQRSGDLYTQLASSMGDTEAKAVFQQLAAEETRHKHYFEELYDTEVARDN
jgi:rubrerythrin